MYSLLSMDDSLDRLKDSLRLDYVLVSARSGLCPRACEHACRALSEEADIACCVAGSEQFAQDWDIGESLPVEAFLCRSSAVRQLLHSGFRPLVGLGELPAALRHAGWRVQMTARPLVEGGSTLGPAQSGRQKYASDLYDLSTEQLLAQGPRVLKRTPFFAAWLSWKRWSEGSPLTRELGYIFQSLLSTARGHRTKLQRATWRDCTLPFRFPASQSSTVVLLFTAIRPWYLRRSLRALHRYWPRENPPRLVLSQDGAERTTQSMIQSLGPQVDHYRFEQQVPVPRDALRKGLAPYYRIAQHFGFSLRQAFQEPATERVIVLEDDIEIGGDFFPYMQRLAPVLERDDSLLAVSAWNDHAIYASCPETLHRTDCFPGLGWMITRKDWLALEADWPDTFWDEWLRRPEVRRDRHFLRPELNRVRNFGRAGTGSSDFFDRFVAPLRWQDEEHHPTTLSDLSERAYKNRLFGQIAEARKIQHPDDMRDKEDAVLVYETRADFERWAHLLGLNPTYHQSGPRAAFEGVVILRIRDAQLYLVPGKALAR